MDFRQDEEVVETFVVETNERIGEIEAGLLALEKMAPAVDQDLVHRIFRAAHSIKAGSNLLKLHNIQELSHRLEHVLQRFRLGELAPDGDNITVLLDVLDRIRQLAENLDRCEAMDISAHLEMLGFYAAPRR